MFWLLHTYDQYPLHYPLLSNRSSILFWAAAIFSNLSASQTPLQLGGMWSTSVQWDVRRARWMGLWAIVSLGLWPSALHFLPVEIPVTPAPFFTIRRNTERWSGWNTAAAHILDGSQQTPHYHLPATPLLFIMWVITYLSCCLLDLPCVQPNITLNC